MKKNKEKIAVPKRVYISGRISGRNINEAKEEFSKAKTLLILIGFDAINPLDLPHKENSTWEDYMIIDIKELFTCDYIVMLHEWWMSKGAKLEYVIAKELGIPVFFSVEELHFSVRE